MQAPSTFPRPAGEWISRWNQLARQIRRELGERYAIEGLSEARAAVLQALATSPQHFTQSDLASDLSLSESNLCGLIERMRSDGLLERVRSALDRRKSVLTLTHSGRERCLVIERIHSEFEAEWLATLPVELQSSIPLAFIELSRSRLFIESQPKDVRRAA